MTPRIAYLCDFDGTIAPSDVGERFAKHFAADGGASFGALEARWRSGELGHRDLTRAECAQLRVTREQADAFVAEYAIDPAFPGFVAAAEARGDEVMVVSEGFDFYIDALLERAGLSRLPRAANRLRFTGGGAVPEFPFESGTCGRCGNCKAQHVRAWRARGFRTVFVGDGFSDRCGAREADAVYARSHLLEWCAAERVAATPFGSFADFAGIDARGASAPPAATGA